MDKEVRKLIVQLLDDHFDRIGNCQFTNKDNHRCGPLPHGHDGPHMFRCIDPSHPAAEWLEDNEGNVVG